MTGNPLTHAYSGVVEKGEGYASKLGYPTINIVHAGDGPQGIYAAQVETDAGTYEAAAYRSHKRPVLEAHLLDFSGSLYGEQVCIRLVQKIRDDAPFVDETSLVQAIEDDIKNVRRFFKKRRAHE